MKQQPSPARIALIQFGESILITALMAAMVAIGPILSSGVFDWKHAAIVFGIAFGFSAAHSGAAYLRAYNPGLATIADADLAAFEQYVTHQVPVDAQIIHPLAVPAMQPIQPLQGSAQEGV